MTEKPATTLYTALLAAQRAMGPVKKDASNPAFRSKYATLQSVLETVEQPLWDNGLVLLQRLDGLDGHTIPILITEIIHAETGDKVESRVAVVCKDPNDPQKLGGALTYYRRYSLLALLGLAPEDDDGNSAARPAQPRKQEEAAAPAAPAANGTRPMLDTDQVLTILGEMDEGKEPWHEIKRYADDQSDGRAGDDVLRIHDKLKAIVAGRKATRQPAGIHA